MPHKHGCDSDQDTRVIGFWFTLAGSTLALLVAACGGGSTTSGASNDAGLVDTGGSVTDADVSSTDAATTSADAHVDAGQVSTGSDDAGPPASVTFRYHPDWQGATAVDVVGGFGNANDWKAPFITLTKGSDGTFTGSAILPAGHYPFFYEIKGDTAAKTPATAVNRDVDPTIAAFVNCPAASPTEAKDKNPCSVMTVPQAAADPLFHVRGTVTLDGTGAAKWMVLIERDETGSHHFPVNRVEVDATGQYDFTAAAGMYRLQALPADDLTVTDAMRKPLTANSVRRALSSTMKVAADVDVDPAEIAYHDYDKMLPIDGNAAALPVMLSYTLVEKAATVRAAVYGEGNDIGDPWWVTPYGTALKASFDGKFTTMQATETMAAAGKAYWWGAWQQSAKGPAGVVWVRQSMVFPLMVK